MKRPGLIDANKESKECKNESQMMERTKRSKNSQPGELETMNEVS